MGVEIMTRAGYDPAAALSVLEKLMALQGLDAAGIEKSILEFATPQHGR
jgi:predicted Zn-dependent protease